LGANPTEIYAAATGDTQETQVVLRYEDGSVATIGYLVNGNPRFSKEIFEVSANGRTARLDNFNRATVWTGRSQTTRRNRRSVDKGQRGALASFVDAVATGGPMPIPLASLLSTTSATLAVARSLALGDPQRL
jgi:hypothetical protein